MRITQTYESVFTQEDILAAQSAGAITGVNGFNTGNPDLDAILGRLDDPRNDWHIPDGIDSASANEKRKLHARAQYMRESYIMVDALSSVSADSSGENPPSDPYRGTVRAELVFAYVGAYNNDIGGVECPEAVKQLMAGTNFKLKSQPK